jgi:hypothetical protein
LRQAHLFSEDDQPPAAGRAVEGNGPYRDAFIPAGFTVTPAFLPVVRCERTTGMSVSLYLDAEQGALRECRAERCNGRAMPQ